MDTDAHSTAGATDLWAFLTGRWQLTRRLVDRSTAVEGRFDGVVRFAPDVDALLHDESGVLAWPGRDKVPATRQLRWLPASSPWAADVCFDDGRPFHHLDLSSGPDQPSHDCRPDIYRGHFEILAPDEWMYEWEVTGPQKNLLLVSRLSRLPHEGLPE
ncbi:DUF6314 family protein [Arthrobacter castelli]|uniref:DUF6314 family protein n=1 Tax=Arthrobacter castelli TaxID=271431 RepID=UPI000418EDFB|nr:DUF6314 family protein [Arthrobacter castelli]